MDKQQLASIIWESANQMRSKIEANEYKDFILGFIFYKFLSEKEEDYLMRQGLESNQIKKVSEDDVEYSDFIRKNLGYFISYENLYSTWLKIGNDFDISNVRDALSAFNRNIDIVHKDLFEGIFDTLETGLSKLGENAKSQTKAARDLIQLINRIPMNENSDYDILGYIYEYLISMFAANAGKKAGEFYTPHEVSLLMSEIIADHLQDRKSISIYDSTSGSGSLLINIGQTAKKYLDGEDKIEYYAQELKQNTYNLTRMNLIMRGIKPSNIHVRNGDTLKQDWPFFEDFDPANTYELIKVDAVVSNPPYSQKWENDNKENDPRYKNYGVAPKGKADYSFLLHDLYHIKDDGIMAIVLPHGVLFRESEEGTIRKNLIEKSNIDTIIGLPANIFYGTSIPTIIMVLKRNKKDSNILFIDASKGYIKQGKKNVLRDRDIKQIMDAMKDRGDIAKFSRLVSKEEIVNNSYNLNIPRYVDSSQEREPYDLNSLMFGGVPKKEVNQLRDYWNCFVGLKEELFEENGSEKLSIKTDKLEEIVLRHTSVQAYFKGFNDSFVGYETYLENELIDGILDVDITNEKDKLVDELFKRIEAIPLIDKYEVYEYLSAQWEIIYNDLEMIHGEGFEVINQVDPNIVIKNKNKQGEIPEVQEGWKGRILPFELVQNLFLEDEVKAINNMEDEMLEISSDFSKIIDSLDQEEKDTELLNDNNDAFKTKEVNEYVKELLDDIETNEINSLKEYLELSKKNEKIEFEDSHPEISWGELEKNKNGSYKAQSVKDYIANLQLEFGFPEDSFESKMITVKDMLEREKILKKDLKASKEQLHLRTKETIEIMDEDQSLMVLKKKWIPPIISNISAMPSKVVKQLIDKIKTIYDKYSETLSEIDESINITSAELIDFISELDATEDDISALKELSHLLSGGNYE